MVKQACRIFLLVLLSCASFSFQPEPGKSKKASLKTIIIDAGHGLPDPGAQGGFSNESDLTLAIALKLGQRLKELLPDCNIIYTRTDTYLPMGITNKDEANRYRAKMANDNHGDLYIAIHVNSDEDRYERRIEGHREETYYVYKGKGKKKKKIEKTRRVPIFKSYKLPCNRKGTETYIWAVNKYDQKQESVGKRDEDELVGERTDSSFDFFESPEAKILASLRTKKYFDQSLAIANFVEEEFVKEGRRSEGVKQRNNKGIWVLQATNMPSILVETGFICRPEEEEYLNSEKGQNEITYAIMRAVLRYKQYIETGSSVLPDSSMTNN